MTPREILKRPIVTEKANKLSESLGQVIFEVDKRANKYQISSAVEEIYGIKVIKVRTMIIPGKTKRRGTDIGKRSSFKKALVSLKLGDTIDFFATE